MKESTVFKVFYIFDFLLALLLMITTPYKTDPFSTVIGIALTGVLIATGIYFLVRSKRELRREKNRMHAKKHLEEAENLKPKASKPNGKDNILPQ